MDQSSDETTVVRSDEAEIKEILGVFDSPAFARRGRDLEYALTRLHQRLGLQRAGLFEMIHVRLRQWAALATGPDDYRDAFAAPVAPLFDLVNAEPPQWAARPGPSRRRRAVAGDLAASVARFNRRWLQFLENVTLDSINRQITGYNLYYVLEKECVVGSARLAARNFVPQTPITRESLLAAHPLLPVIALVG
jgi:hypothetical protein